MVAGVRKLPAAHRLVIDVDPWRVREECYWRMEDAPALDDDPVECVRARLDDVGRHIVRSDVPVGVALSGGIDSASVAALAVKHYPGNLTAFTIGYTDEPGCDERWGARDSAAWLGVPLVEVELSTDAYVGSFSDIVWLRDDPIADVAGFGYYSVMAAARDHGVKVMLQGHGGDELFWGYRWVRDIARMAWHEKALRSSSLPLRLMDFLEFSLPSGGDYNSVVYWLKSGGGLMTALRGARCLKSRQKNILPIYEMSPYFSSAQRRFHQAITDDFSGLVHPDDLTEVFGVSDSEDNPSVTVTRMIADTYLQQVGMAQGDRLGMACSVEGRTPLVDHLLVETVIGLRKRNRDCTAPPKDWLRRAVTPLLTPEILNRPKRGFAVPFRNWHGALIKAWGGMLPDGYLVRTGLIRQEAADAMARDIRPLTMTHRLSFLTLTLEAWCDRMKAVCGGYDGR